MILKLYTVRNIKRDFFNPPFVIEDEKFLKDVILRALIEAKIVPEELKDFSVSYCGDFDNTLGIITNSSSVATVLDCSTLLDRYLEATNYETYTGGGEDA